MTVIQLQDYAIHIGPLSRALPAFVDDLSCSALVVVADENTQRDCVPRLEQDLDGRAFRSIITPAGEAHKNIDTCTRIWAEMMRLQLDRQALVLNLGGGVIGDMGGFSAATFKRGLRFAQIPTTVLAQVDASIGGKLGVDFGGVKNSVGLFRNPEAVFIDTRYLDTLPPRERRSGLAEIIKHSLIADARQWDSLRDLPSVEAADWDRLIPDSLRVKEKIVRTDPLEKGLRKSLNFGHTIGHAVEGASLGGPEPRLHGEAIAVGMVAEAWLSHRWLGLSQAALDDIRAVVLRLYGHHPVPQDQFAEIMDLMQNDKKNTRRGINFSLLPAIGACRVDRYGPARDVRAALQYYNRA